MKPHAILVAGALALACLFIGPAFAQEVLPAAAPVAVVASPATQAAVQEQAWWNGLASEAIAALASIIGLAVPVITGLLWDYLRSKSKLAGILFTQARLDKLNAGIQNQIRAEAAKLEGRFSAGAPLSALPPAVKKDLATAAQPKIEQAFRETLQHFGKKPGSAELRDMILGHVETALRAPAAAAAGPAAYPQNRG